MATTLEALIAEALTDPVGFTLPGDEDGPWPPQTRHGKGGGHTYDARCAACCTSSSFEAREALTDHLIAALLAQPEVVLAALGYRERLTAIGCEDTFEQYTVSTATMFDEALHYAREWIEVTPQQTEHVIALEDALRHRVMWSGDCPCDDDPCPLTLLNEWTLPRSESLYETTKEGGE